ncbi:MAG: glycosyltransferase, partial [Bacteroidota bacterium]|nr:glycosyltransferase [Bacteroidota bacterium]MDX5468835.1 glycosyltransferase [Bacteroidota bacterium]
MKLSLAIFSYNRPLHLKNTVEALLKNPGAEQMEVHFFSDAAANKKDESKVAQVRGYLESLSDFPNKVLHFAESNKGLSASIIEGVTEVLRSSDGIIVLEDDMEVKPFFLEYMTMGLERYANQNEVCCIHGYVYPIDNLPQTFFLKGADCWGWATWPRAWSLFEEDGTKLLRELKAKGLVRRLDYNGSYPYHRMLMRQVKGKNQSWAVRWYASALLHDKLTLYPGKSLLRNTGNDNSGTHSKKTSIYEPILAEKNPDFPTA